MSDAGAFLARVVGALNKAGIPHMVAGSFASTHHGVPRTTQDIDLVIEPAAASLRAFVAGLSPEARTPDLRTVYPLDSSSIRGDRPAIRMMPFFRRRSPLQSY